MERLGGLKHNMVSDKRPETAGVIFIFTLSGAGNHPASAGAEGMLP
ncbi:hypothetical protein DVDV_4014 [Desulfovibrio sp. DV]|nr:hypothetical protein DVDV_4014 [Desulfovibrio sp. DV]